MSDFEEKGNREKGGVLPEDRKWETEIVRFCRNCGTPLDQDAKFCEKCGAEAGGEDLSGMESRQSDENAGVSAEDAIGSEAQDSEGVQMVKSVLRKIKKWLEAATFIFLIIFLYWAFCTRKPINDVKSMVFDQYGSQELEDAVKLSMPESSWGKEKLGKKHYAVTLSGFCPDLYSNIEVTFDVNYSGGSVYASVEGVRIDGDYYDDLFTIAMVMGGIY